MTQSLSITQIDINYSNLCHLKKNTLTVRHYNSNSTYMSDKGQETVGCLYPEICTLREWMSFRCAAANMVSLPLQPLTLHMASRPAAVNNMSNGRQVSFPLLLKLAWKSLTKWLQALFATTLSMAAKCADMERSAACYYGGACCCACGCCGWDSRS